MVLPFKANNVEKFFFVWPRWLLFHWKCIQSCFHEQFASCHKPERWKKCCHFSCVKFSQNCWNSIFCPSESNQNPQNRFHVKSVTGNLLYFHIVMWKQNLMQIHFRNACDLATKFTFMPFCFLKRELVWCDISESFCILKILPQSLHLCHFAFWIVN